jgi:hypothetical protein
LKTNNERSLDSFVYHKKCIRRSTKEITSWEELSSQINIDYKIFNLILLIKTNN